MLRGLFGSNPSDSPTPPKNHIAVVCPSCGASQFEPKLVVSTFCKGCGVHLSIRKRKVVASEITRSGGAGVDDLWKSATPPRKTPQPSTPASSSPLGEALPDSVELKEVTGSAVSQVKDDSPPSQPASDSGTTEQVGLAAILAQAAVTTVPSPTPSPPAKPAEAAPSTLQKMMDHSIYKQQYFKEIECFACNHHLKVSRSSKTANCTQCGEPICIEDFEINMQSNQSIRTRGDVVIRKRGHVTASSVECKDLRCMGVIEANITCSNDAFFSTEGQILGELHCHRLVIEKGAFVTFLNAVHAQEIEVHGKVKGTLHAAGKVLITAIGTVEGPVTARSVSIEPGGELNGAMNIIRPTATSGPLPSSGP